MHSAGVLELTDGDAAQGAAYLQELLREFPEYGQSKDVHDTLNNYNITKVMEQAQELAQSASTVDTAIDTLLTLAEEHPQHEAAGEALYRASHYAASFEQWERCETIAKQYLSLEDVHSSTTAARELLAQSQLKQGKYSQALEQYRTLLAESPEQHPRREIWKEENKSVHAHLQAAAYNSMVDVVETNDCDTAQAQLEEYIEKYPNDSKIDSLQYTLATRLITEDNPKAAKALFSNLQQSKDSKVAYASKAALCELTYHEGNFSKAATTTSSLLDEIEKADKSHISTHQRHRLEELMQEAYHAAAIQAQENGDLEAVDSHIASLRARFPNAERTADTIILKANSLLADAQNLQSTKSYSEAQAAFIRCKSLLTECEKIYLTFDEQKRSETPLEDIQRLLPAVNTRLAFLSQQIQHNTLLSAVNAGDHKTIQETARSILESEGAAIYHDEASLLLGKSLLATKEYQQAEEVLEQLIEHTSSIEDPKARLVLGSLHLEKAQPEKAATRFAEVATSKATKESSKELQEEIARCQIEALFGLLECCIALDAERDTESVAKQLRSHPLFGDAEQNRLKTLLK